MVVSLKLDRHCRIRDFGQVTDEMITNKGKVLWANAIGNLQDGFTGTVKASSSTTLEAASGPKWVAEQFVGQDVYSGSVVGTVLSNTETVLTVARWENLPTAANPSHSRKEESGEPPIVSSAYSIASGTTPAAWIGVSADTAEPKAENETLKGEIKTSEGGLIRALATFKYLGGKEYEVKVTYTANVHDATPITLAKIGIFNAHNGGILLFESLLTATAEIKESGDAVTITDVVTGS
jgi:hypothetical protein